MPANVTTAKDIFLAAAEMPHAERTAYLDEACAGNTSLRRRVEDLLRAHDGPDSVLDQPAVGQGNVKSGGKSATQADGDVGTGQPHSDPNPTVADGSAFAGDDLAFLAPSGKPGSLGRLGHYEVLEVLGKGGFGTVFKAFDEKLHRVVAIKVLSPAYAANGSARKRFIREARTAAAVKNEHVVGIYDVEDDAQPPYLAMEMIDGVSLQDKIDKRGPLGVTEILRIGMQMAEGLAAAHKQGLVHRDIKPANILLENGVERVKITDFGLARAVDDASVTQSGVVAGTPMYMSPEQAEGLPIDHRSDLFSLGTVLYAMCTGHPPFRASGTHAVLKRVIDAAPRPIREINHEIPEWLCDIIAKLHAKKPEDRFQTAKEVAELLGQHLAHLQQPGSVAPPPPQRELTPRHDPVKTNDWPVWPIALVGIVLLALTPVFLYLFRVPEVIGVAAIGYVVTLFLWLRAGALESDGRPRGHSRPTLLPVALVGLSIFLVAIVFLFLLHAKHGEMPFTDWGLGPVVMLVLGEGLCALWLYARLRGHPRARRGSPDPAETPDRRSPSANGNDAAGSGDPRRARPSRRPLAVATTLLILFALAVAWSIHLNRQEIDRRKEAAANAPAVVTLGGLYDRLGLDKVILRSVVWEEGKLESDGKTIVTLKQESAALKKRTTSQAELPAGQYRIEVVCRPGYRLAKYEIVSQGVASQGPGGGASGLGEHIGYVPVLKPGEHIVINVTTEKLSAEAERQRNALRGKWRILSGEANGEALPKELLSEISIAFEDALEVKIADVFESRYPFALGGGAWPKTIMSVGAAVTGGSKSRSGDGVEKVHATAANLVQRYYLHSEFRGIYELEGNQLKLCFAQGGYAPPKRFDSRTDDKAQYGALNLVLVRAANDQAGWVQLFDGKGLSGWRVVGTPANSWQVRESLLWGSGGQTHLVTDRQFSQFHLKMELRISPGGEARILACANPTDQGLRDRSLRLPALEVKSSPLDGGGLMTQVFALLTEGATPGTLNVTGPFQADRWVRLELIAQDKRLTAIINGRTLEQTDVAGKFKPGPIIFQLGKADTVVEFRKIEIKELPPKLPDTAEQVLPALAGAWKGEYTQKIYGGKPDVKKISAVTVHDWIVGQKWLRQRVQMENEGFQSVTTFEPSSKTFRDWFFHSRGLIFGPSTGRWDPATRTITWTNLPEDGVILLMTLRFVDADTFAGEILIRDKEGKTVFEMASLMKRTAEHVGIDETTAAGPLPPQMAVLDRIVGAWEVTGIIKDGTNPEGLKATWRNTSRKILGGRVIATKQADHPRNDDAYALYTFDSISKAYGRWLFKADGTALAYGGGWDEKTQTLKWHWTDKSGRQSTATWRWRDADHQDWQVVTKDAVGKTTSDIQGTSVRQSELLPAIAPFDAAKAKEHQDAWAKHLGVDVEVTNSIGMKLRLIPPGKNGVGPGAAVECAEPFFLGTTEVTVEQFRRFVNDEKFKTAGETSKLGGMLVQAGTKTKRGAEYVWSHPDFARSGAHPVTLVTWHDAQAFCDWLSQKEGRAYRLPTMAEWRWAERAGSAARFYFGDTASNMDPHAWHIGNSERHTQAVGGKERNPWGLFDVYGNVWELSYDWQRNGKPVDPRMAKAGPGASDRVMFTGGCYDALPDAVIEPAFGPPHVGYSHLGFRVIVSGDLTQKRSPAAVNNQLRFDGVTDHVELPRLPYQPGDPLCVELWATPQAPLDESAERQLLWSSGFWDLHIHEKGHWSFVRPYTSQVFSRAPVTYGKRVHLAGVWDGKKISLYVDGLIQPGPGNTSKVEMPLNDEFLIYHRLGGANPTPKGIRFPYCGAIDQVRISRSARYTIDFTPPARFDADKDTVALYLFQEGKGETLQDESGNDRHGRIVGARWAKRPE